MQAICANICRWTVSGLQPSHHDVIRTVCSRLCYDSSHLEGSRAQKSRCGFYWTGAVVSSGEQFKNVSVDLFNVGGCEFLWLCLLAINTSKNTTNNLRWLFIGGKKEELGRSKWVFTGFWQTRRNAFLLKTPHFLMYLLLVGLWSIYDT